MAPKILTAHLCPLIYSYNIFKAFYSAVFQQISVLQLVCSRLCRLLSFLYLVKFDPYFVGPNWLGSLGLIPIFILGHGKIPVSDLSVDIKLDSGYPTFEQTLCQTTVHWTANTSLISY